MVLIRLRDTETIIETSTDEANKLLRKEKAFLVKSTNLVKVFIPVKIKGFEIGEYEMTFNGAKKLGKSAIIIEWLSIQEIKELKVKTVVKADAKTEIKK